jgi:uncharacterized membrane protein YdjX (TVP38/TMEM64 family)
MGLVFTMGWHRELSPEMLIRHRTAIGAFVVQHQIGAVLVYVAAYAAAVTISIPGAWFLTVSGGFLFGVATGGLAAVTGATIGATCIFLIAKTAIGDYLVRRAGPLALRLVEGFRQNAFSYLLFLRLVPAFPFFLVNLVPALAGVRLLPFVAATAIGIVPATFIFAFVGTGFDSVLAAQESTLRDCLAAGHVDCRLNFGIKDVLTGKLVAALAALGCLALLPVIVKWFRGNTADPSASDRGNPE